MALYLRVHVLPLCAVRQKLHQVDVVSQVPNGLSLLRLHQLHQLGEGLVPVEHEDIVPRVGQLQHHNVLVALVSAVRPPHHGLQELEVLDVALLLNAVDEVLYLPLCHLAAEDIVVAKYLCKSLGFNNLLGWMGVGVGWGEEKVVQIPREERRKYVHRGGDGIYT